MTCHRADGGAGGLELSEQSNIRFVLHGLRCLSYLPLSYHVALTDMSCLPCSALYVLICFCLDLPRLLCLLCLGRAGLRHALL